MASLSLVLSRLQCGHVRRPASPAETPTSPSPPSSRYPLSLLPLPSLIYFLFDHFLPLPTSSSPTSLYTCLVSLPVTSCYSLDFYLPSRLILCFKNGGSADATGLPGNVVNQQCSSGSSVVAACDGAVGRDPGVRPTRDPLPLNTVVVHRGRDPTGIAPARRCPRSAV